MTKPVVSTLDQEKALEALAARVRERPLPPRLKVEGDAIVLKLEDDVIGAFKIMETLGSVDVNFQNGLINVSELRFAS